MNAGHIETDAGVERAVDASEETEVRLVEVTRLGVRSEPRPLAERIEAERGLEEDDDDDDVTSMSVFRKRETWDDCEEIDTRLLLVSRLRRVKAMGGTGAESARFEDFSKWDDRTGKAALVAIYVLGGEGCSLSEGVLTAMDSEEEREDKVSVYGGEWSMIIGEISGTVYRQVLGNVGDQCSGER